MIMHFISLKKKELEEAGNTFGFIVIVLRFFTIAGKHVSSQVSLKRLADKIDKLKDWQIRLGV